MTSSNDNWVIESNYLVEGAWTVMSCGAVGQKDYQNLEALNDMTPVPFERAMQFALGVSGWNMAHYNFRFRNVDTDEEIPFDAFPEINQFYHSSR